MGLLTQTDYQYYLNTQKFTATASQTEFLLTFDPLPASKADFLVYVNDVEVDDDLYSYSNTGGNAGKGIFTSGRTVSDIVEIKLKKSNAGNYRYIELKNIVNNFMIAYVGQDKVIPKMKRADVLFYAKRGIQEFSYEISRIEKIQEVEIPDSLGIVMPKDYVNYVQISRIDDIGVEHPLIPARFTSNPSQSVLQDDEYNYLFDNDDSLLTSSPILSKRFREASAQNISGNDPADDGDLNHERISAFGKRFGLIPELTQKNGTFVIDETNGVINFSSDLVGVIVTIKYISDGLGTDDEMKVHKLAEDAIYKYIIHSVASTRSNYPEYLVMRFKKEKFAAMRNAKLRLSNLKVHELAHVMRNKSKQIKH